MHVYIYDEYLNHSKYRNVLARIETRVTDLGLNGKIIRLNIMKNVKEAVQSELRRGAKTIVAVGDNGTVSRILNAIIIPERQNFAEVPLGIIPVGKNCQEISEFFGIPKEEFACDILSSRRIETMDLGMVNGAYFLSQAVITNKGTKIEIDGDYSIESDGPGEVKIINFPLNNDMPGEASTSPQDGRLELFLKTSSGKLLNILSKENSKSVFSFKKLFIYNQAFPVIIDGSAKVPCPAEIRPAEKKIQVIVGKERRF